jgi:VIT1/CCC1 family predicted Fe2+/Mn2+ transporter
VTAVPAPSGAPPVDPAIEHVPGDNHPAHHYHGEEWHTPRGRAIREVVFGMNDGLVTTIAFVAGAAKTLSDPRLVLLAGLAEMVAGAAAMGMGSYLSTKSQRDFFESEIARETKEIRETPEHEIAEAREIYKDLGFEPDEVEMIVKRLRANPALFLKLMLRDELGITDETLENPWKNAAIMSVSFFLGALPVLLPYLILSDATLAFRSALAVSTIAMFAIGAARTWVTKRPFLLSGLEGLAVGVAATAVGWLGGIVVAKLLGL